MYLFSLSIHTGLNIGEIIQITDIYGNAHDLTPHHVRVMLGVGWACFLSSWLINIAYYKFHPSAVVFSLSDKRKLFMFGRDVFPSEKKKPSLHGEVEGEISFKKYNYFSKYLKLQQEQSWRWRV